MILAIAFVAIGLAFAALGIHVGHSDDAPGAAGLGFLLMLGSFAIGYKFVRLSRRNALDIHARGESCVQGGANAGVHASRRRRGARNLLWIARLTGTPVVALLMLMFFGEPAPEPISVREWVCLSFFPFGFSIGYLLGWRWPLLAGCVSLSCMAIFLMIIGGAFDVTPYLIWSGLSVPGAIYLVAGLKLRCERRLLDSDIGNQS